MKSDGKDDLGSNDRGNRVVMEREKGENAVRRLIERSEGRGEHRMKEEERLGGVRPGQASLHSFLHPISNILLTHITSHPIPSHHPVCRRILQIKPLDSFPVVHNSDRSRTKRSERKSLGKLANLPTDLRQGIISLFRSSPSFLVA